MNIQAEQPNILPKPMFQNFKLPEFFPKKIKSAINEQRSEPFSHLKENVVKINNLKHEFRTPSIVNTHKLPKAFNNNHLNSKIETEKKHDEKKVSDHKYYFFVFPFENILTPHEVKTPKRNPRR